MNYPHRLSFVHCKGFAVFTGLIFLMFIATLLITSKINNSLNDEANIESYKQVRDVLKINALLPLYHQYNCMNNEQFTIEKLSRFNSHTPVLDYLESIVFVKDEILVGRYAVHIALHFHDIDSANRFRNLHPTPQSLNITNEVINYSISLKKINNC
jgi:hypothetical protein